MISEIGTTSYNGMSKDDSLNNLVFTHVGDPTEDIGIEANVVFRNVYTALNEDLPL